MSSVVLDTNIIISAALVSLGKPAKIIELISDDKLDLIYNDRILNEYEEVLSRERLGFSIEAQRAALDMIVDKGTLIEANISSAPMIDEDDRVFYDTAITANAILITGNKKHFPTEPMVMTPSEFLDTFDIISKKG